MMSFEATTEKNVRVKIEFFTFIEPITPEYEPTTVDCRVTFKRTKETFEASAQIFACISQAKEHVSLLKSVNHKFVPHTYFCAEDTEFRGLIILERLSSIRKWFSVPDLWKKNDNNEVISCGPGLINNLGQTLEALKAVHDSGNRHGNLLNGISFDVHGNLKLHSFAKKLPNGDFAALKSLCSLVVLEQPPLPEPVDVPLLLEFFDFKLYMCHYRGGLHYSLDNVQNITKFLYKLPKLWDLGVVGSILEILDNLNNPKKQIEYKIHKSIKFKNHYEETWYLNVHDEFLRGVLYHENGFRQNGVPLPDISQMAAVLPANEKYHSSGGIGTFSHNANKHAGSSPFDGLRRVLEQFPGVHLKIFLEVMRSPLFDEVFEPMKIAIPLHEHVAQILFALSLIPYSI